MLRTSTGQQWTVHLVGADPASLPNGDSLEMVVAASADPTGWVSQTIVLTRSSRLVLFAAAMNAVPGGALVPSIPSANFTMFNDDGVACMDGIRVPAPGAGTARSWSSRTTAASSIPARR